MLYSLLDIGFGKGRTCHLDIETAMHGTKKLLVKGGWVERADAEMVFFDVCKFQEGQSRIILEVLL